MSEINKPDAVLPTNWQDERSRNFEASYRNPYSSHPLPTEEIKAKRIDDVASILGMRPQDVPEGLIEKIGDLLDRAEFAREQNRQMAARIDYLEKLVDAHAFLPVVNRHAFLRESGRRIEHAARMEFVCSVAVFYCLQMDSIRAEKGLNAAIYALGEIARRISVNIKKTDVIGHLGFGNFGVFMPFAGTDEAVAVAQRLTIAVGKEKLDIEGSPIFPSLAFGVSEYQTGNRSEDMIAAADAELIKSIKDIK